MFKKLKIIYLIPSIFFSLLVNSEEVDINNISSISFNSLPVTEKSLTENDYIDFIKSHIFSQPEFAFALAGENEKKYLLTSAVRSRFPTISGSIINDEVLDRNVDDFTSIRKRQDDSFDAIAEIRQPIYTGGRISGEINLARIERNNSIVKKRSVLSELIVTSNEIFLTASIYYYINDHAQKLIFGILPFKEKMQNRVESGTIDPAEYAVFLTRLNKLQSTIYMIEARAKTYIARYENFFKSKFTFMGFPKVDIFFKNKLNTRNSFELDIRKNNYLASVENVKIKRSDYLPQLGLKARYTEYDINKDSTDNDIRGGLYLSMPIFNFGKGWADIQAQKAQSRAIRFEIDIEEKISSNRRNELLTIIESSNKAVIKLKDALNDTKKQRRILEERILLTGFSPVSLLDATENELSQLRLLLETEFDLLEGYYNILHHNQLLINKMKISL
mgnify:CR=1 FL=1|tara:strand:+ start:6553 stop:7890 length:1338 start_codon:yes stop_codon:yes gene_type:complete